METNNFKIKDRISVSLIEPNKGKGAQSYAILLPGFLDSKDYKDLKRLANKFTHKGIASLRFNPTGTWSSGGAIENYKVSQYRKDLDDVIDFLEENKEPEDIILIGHSIGGMLSVIGGEDKRVSSVVAIMPSPSFTDAEVIKRKLPRWKEKGVKTSKRKKPGKDEKIEIKVPYSFVEDSFDYNAREVISQYSKPLLLIAGEKDNSVTADSVRSIYKAANLPKEFKVLKGVGHDYRVYDKQISEVNDEVIDFLKRYKFIK